MLPSRIQGINYGDMARFEIRVTCIIMLSVPLFGHGPISNMNPTAIYDSDYVSEQVGQFGTISADNARWCFRH